MRKAKNVILGVSCMMALFMSLVGCANVNEQTAQPVESIAENVVEEQPDEETINGFLVLTKITKATPYVLAEDTMQYTGDTTGNMSDAVNNAESVSLDDTIFTVTASKGSTSYFPGLNKSGLINLYAKRDNGNGSSFTVSISSGHSIESINVDFKSNSDVATVYKSGEVEVDGVDGSYDIDDCEFTIKNTQSSGDSNKTIEIRSILIKYEGSAKEVASCLPTQLSLSYNYLKQDHPGTDSLINSITGRTSYGAWSWLSTNSTGITYTGNSSGGNSSIQLRGNNGSGIAVTGNENSAIAGRITIEWDDHTPAGSEIQIYAKNEAYTAVSDLYGTNAQKGTQIVAFEFDTKDEQNKSSFEINTQYKYIGVRAKSSQTGIYLRSIDIDWNYNSYTYSNVAVRFGNVMKQSLWNRLHSESAIQGYGVMLSTSDYLSSSTIQSKYNTALTDHTIDEAITTICSGDNVKNFYTPKASKANPDALTNDQKTELGLTDDYYIWNLYKNVSTENLKKGYVAVAYIRVASEIVFLNEVETSVKDLAHDLIEENDELNENSYDGSLNNLANLA